MSLIKIILDEIAHIKSGRKELREFGLTVGIILIVLGGIALWRGKAVYPYLLGIGIFLTAAGLAAPGMLKAPQKVWMGIAVVIGFFTSRVVLTVFFYAVLTPRGMLTRILGKDILDERIDKNASSYWKTRTDGIKDKTSYENQY
jgi:hypothetical protein